MGGIGNETAVLAVDEQIELLQHGLPDQHLVAEHERFLERVASVQLHDEGFGHTDGFRPPIGVLGHALTANAKAQTKGDVLGHDRAHRSSVDERVRLVGPDLFGRQQPASDQGLVDGIRQSGGDTDFTHPFQMVGDLLASFNAHFMIRLAMIGLSPVRSTP